MVRIGYHASHEQFSPSCLLQWSREACDAGFDFLFSSDHFHPWSEHHSEAGFSWAWMGAALQATPAPGRIICCPFGRYHPAVIAQAAATLSEMFPGRFALGIGSGERLNENITGEAWPDKDRRNEMLEQSAAIIRALWRGEEVTTKGPIYTRQARLFTLPPEPPLLLGAALSDETAEFVGRWADGLLTVSKPEKAARKTIESFRKTAGPAKPLFLKVGLAYSRKGDDDALDQAYEYWRNLSVSPKELAEIATPKEFDRKAGNVERAKLHESLRISSDPRRFVDWLNTDINLGYEEIVLHNVNPNQSEFIQDFSRMVLPGLRR